MTKTLMALTAILALSACTNAPYPATCGCMSQFVPKPLTPEQDLVNNVGDREFFAFNKAKLSTNADTALGRQAAWLTKYPSVKVLIAGNADERGTEAYNLALGNKRATAAADYLLANGIAPTRIQTVSYGKDCPLATGSDAAAYQQNRNAITSVQGYNPQNCH